MKESPLVQYGVAIDPHEMVKPPDPEELEVDPKTPGIDDPEYMARRRWIFKLTRKHRLERLGPPLFDYSPEETALWKDVSGRLHELHVKGAGQMDLQAKH